MDTNTTTISLAALAAGFAVLSFTQGWDENEIEEYIRDMAPGIRQVSGTAFDTPVELALIEETRALLAGIIDAMTPRTTNTLVNKLVNVIQ